MSAFERNGLSFAIDRVGVELASPEEIQTSIPYDQLDIGDDDVPAGVIAERISALLGESVEDEDAHFDFAVSFGGEIVAAVVIECDDDDNVLFVGGERSRAVTDEQLASALAAALARPD